MSCAAAPIVTRDSAPPWQDDCGSHASPYHSHMNPACEYANSTSGHSTLVSIMLDGRGTYGLYEAAGGVVPSDLDACGGHYGPVPATTYDGVTYAAASNVYHYHWTAFVRREGRCEASIALLHHISSHSVLLLLSHPSLAAPVQVRHSGQSYPGSS